MRRDGDEERLTAFIPTKTLHVEIGFGRPHYLCELAALEPSAHILGFEVKRRWCRDASRRCTREECQNVRIIEGDARPYIDKYLPEGGVAGFHILFPDPWWKKRHHKRRLVGPDFVQVLHHKLRPGGHIVFRTDVPAYADLVEEIMEEHGGFDIQRGMVEPCAHSHREKKCIELGIPVFSFRFIKEEKL